ncbi:MAG: class I SAM-dependent methyltransferase [Actinomycetota bacterium]|nr:class I SAM-dependent methyltransferase [Actinomycetota bacterium]
MSVDSDMREMFAERLIEDTTRALELVCVHLGLTLGLYQAVDDLGSPTAAEVAKAVAVASRYAREWLEQQATAGTLDCDDPSVPADERRYRLPDAHAEVLLHHDSLYHTGPAATMFAGVTRVIPQLVSAYRDGGGVPYAAYGGEIRHGIAALNRPMFQHYLADWLAAVPDLDARLRSAPPARVLDLGCGRGHSGIALARAYPTITVYGVDLDTASIEEAREEAAAAGVEDRVTFAAGDAAASDGNQPYDLVTMFETLYDMGNPVGALRRARSELAEGGVVFIADDRVADDFTPRGDLVERFQFGWSVLHCLPATMAEDPIEANGTMLRAPTLERWASEAGFSRVDHPQIDNDFWRFYVLRP